MTDVVGRDLLGHVEQRHSTVSAPIQPLGHTPARLADRPFPELLRHQRVRAGLTQRALADLSTVSPRAIRDLEAGRANARTQTILLLADGLRLQGAAREHFVRASLNRRRTSPFDLDDGAAPKPVNALCGREAEVRAMVETLESGSRRLISLSGLAGVGKSRVAAEVAARLRSGPRWPVLWIGVDVPALQGHSTAFGPLMRSLRSLLAANPQDGVAQIRRLVAHHDALLVLDGVAEAGIAPKVAELLAYCPGLRVISTSRTPWHLPGVPASVLAPLGTPPPAWPAGSSLDDLADVPAVRLFVDRLAEVRPGFVLGSANAAAAAEMCRRLDGLPLALEVVAGRGRVLSLQQLLDVPVPDLLDLTVPSRSGEVPGTIGDLIGGGVAQLGDVPRAILCALVRGDHPWTVPEVAAALRGSMDEVVDGLDVLIGHGLIQASHGESATDLRVPHLLRVLLLREHRTGGRS